MTSPRKSPRGRHTICCFGRRTLQVSGFQLTLWNPVSTLSLLNPSSRLLPVLDRVPSPALLSPSLGFGDLFVHPLKSSFEGRCRPSPFDSVLSVTLSTYLFCFPRRLPALCRSSCVGCSGPVMTRNPT